MIRYSIRYRSRGPVHLIHMTSRILGIPVFKVIAYYVDGLLIDTGFARCRQGFLKVCDQLPTLKAVVNTHHHEDHTGNNDWITKKFGIVPMGHSKAISYMTAPSNWIKCYRRFVWGTPAPSEMVEIDSELTTDHYRFLVIPTPGHSDDHLCLFEPEEGWLFSGDLFLNEEVRYTREDEDVQALLDSLKRIADLKPRLMFCSFSGVIEQPEMALQRKIHFLEHIRKSVEEGLNQGLSPREIRKKLLGPGDRFYWITAGQISKRNTIRAFLNRRGRVCGDDASVDHPG